MPDSHGGMDFDQALNLKLGIRPDSLDNVQQSKLPNSETSRPSSLDMGRVPDLIPPTRPDICDLSLIRQEPAETVHHYWARFLLVMDRIKDCREENTISIFYNNCMDKGILNAIGRRKITRFTRPGIYSTKILCDGEFPENRKSVLGQSGPEYNPSPQQKGALHSGPRYKNQKAKTP